MANLLLRFNTLKKEYKKTHDEKILKELNESRKQFVEMFRIYNKKEIEEYLKIKDK